MFATTPSQETPDDQERPAAPARRRTWLLLVTGVVAGALGAVLLPKLLAPVLPDALTGRGEVVRGTVADKQWKEDRLLLSIDAHRGALLATFRQRTEELDLLIQEGDSVALQVTSTGPFADDPRLMQVRKFPAGPGRPPARAADSPATGGVDSPSTRTPEGDTGEPMREPGERTPTEASDADTGAAPDTTVRNRLPRMRAPSSW